MSMGRFMVTLYDEERRALWELARRERRDPREQAALSIRRDLEQRGLLPDRTRADREHSGEATTCQG